MKGTIERLPTSDAVDVVVVHGDRVARARLPPDFTAMGALAAAQVVAMATVDAVAGLLVPR